MRMQGTEETPNSSTCRDSIGCSMSKLGMSFLRKQASLLDCFSARNSDDLFNSNYYEKGTRRPSLYTNNKSLVPFNTVFKSVETLSKSYLEFMANERCFNVFATWAVQFVPKSNVTFLVDQKLVTTDEDMLELWSKYIADPDVGLDPSELSEDKRFGKLAENTNKIGKMIHLRLQKLYFKSFLSSVENNDLIMACLAENAPAKTIVDMIDRPTEFKIFKLFAQKEFATENVEFIEIYKIFLDENDPIEKKHVADKIVDEYILDQSNYFLNVSENVRKDCINKHKLNDPMMFHKVHQEIIRIMTDMFIRFVADDLWVAYLADFERTRPFQSFYRLNGLIEHGTVCEVFSGVSIKNNTPYRVVKKVYGSKEELIQGYNRALLKVKHRSMICIEEIFKDLKNLHMYIVLPICTETLEEYMSSKDSIFRDPTTDQLCHYFLQFVELARDFEKMALHFEIGELYEGNVYMSSSHTTVFIDQNIYSHRRRDLLLFELPSDQTDVYQLGMLFYNMIHVGSDETNQKEFLQNFKMKEIAKLISSMVDPLASNRPSIDKVHFDILKKEGIHASICPDQWEIKRDFQEVLQEGRS
jgi:hypothetical protein